MTIPLLSVTQSQAVLALRLILRDTREEILRALADGVDASIDLPAELQGELESDIADASPLPWLHGEVARLVLNNRADLLDPFAERIRAESGLEPEDFRRALAVALVRQSLNLAANLVPRSLGQRYEGAAREFLLRGPSESFDARAAYLRTVLTDLRVHSIQEIAAQNGGPGKKGKWMAESSVQTLMQDIWPTLESDLEFLC